MLELIWGFFVLLALVCMDHRMSKMNKLNKAMIDELKEIKFRSGGR